MVVLIIIFFPSFKQDESINQLFANVPTQLQAFVGDTSSFNTISGYVSSQLFDIRVPLLTLIMAVVLGVGLTVTEEKSGQLYQLIAAPVSRSRIALEKWLTLVGIFALVHLALFASTVGTIWLIHESFPLGSLANLTLMCFLLTLAIGSVTFALGFATGSRGFTILIGSFVAFGSYFLSSFAKSVSWLEPYDFISLFHYYNTSALAKTGLQLRDVLVLLSVTVITVVISLILFSKRDIGV